MEDQDFSLRIRRSRELCAVVLQQFSKHARNYLSRYPESAHQGFFSSYSIPQKEIISAYYEYAALLCREWDRLAEQLVGIGALMQERDKKMDSEGVLCCEMLLKKGEDFQGAFAQYMTQNDAILKTENPIPQLRSQTKQFLFAAEQFSLLFMKESV